MSLAHINTQFACQIAGCTTTTTMKTQFSHCRVSKHLQPCLPSHANPPPLKRFLVWEGTPRQSKMADAPHPLQCLSNICLLLAPTCNIVCRVHHGHIGLYDWPQTANASMTKPPLVRRSAGDRFKLWPNPELPENPQCFKLRG